jgi:hypothetical protein
LALVCTGFKDVHGQEFYNLQPKNVKLHSSVFSKLEIIDTRYDTVHIGWVKRGLLNRKEEVKFPWQKTLKQEIVRTVTNLLDSTTDSRMDGTLLINLRNFFISEHTEALSEEGLFAIKAGFYLKQDTIYRKMFTVDERYTIKAGGLDVTDKLLDTVKTLYGELIKRAANFDLAGLDMSKQYTAYDIEHIVDAEKKDIPIYQVAAAKKGLYATYEDFRNNHPARENIIVQYRKGFSRPFVYEMEADGKKGKEILRKYYYLVSDGERMFISRTLNLYELTKTNNEFYFTGLGKDDADMGTVLLASAAFGLIAGGMAANHDTAVFEFRLDYLTGKFVPVRKIKD